MVNACALAALLAFITPSLAEYPLKDFTSPPTNYRTRHRYWFPDASVPVESVVADIEAVKEVGGGGIQLLPFYNFGFSLNPTELPYSAWDEYGFGSEAFINLFASALNATEQNGLGFTFFIGGNQGQGVPAEPLTTGLAVHLVYGEATVAGGDVFDGPLPVDNFTGLNFDLGELGDFMHVHLDFGPKKLVGVVAAGVVDTAANGTSIQGDEFFLVSVDEESLIEITEHVTDGKLTWEAPNDFANYTIFALYERYTNQRAIDGVLNATDIIANGSWFTDHFSAAGAQLVIDFWEEQILDDEIRQMLKYVGEHSIEDSMEMAAGLWWSEDFLERFTRLHGYCPIKYLPLMFHEVHSYRRQYPPYSHTFVPADGPDSTERSYMQDYRTALSDGYNEYSATFEAWAQTLGLTHSAQTAYHLPLDMPGSVSYVGVPEIESLAFPKIDHSLQYTGAAHLNDGTTIISSELGSVFPAYSMSAGELVHKIKLGFAGGVNSIAIQAMAYSGEYVGTTWPGLTAVGFFTGDGWNPRYPDWKYLNESLLYTARNQVVLRAGRVQRDIAFYLYKPVWLATEEYPGDDLRSVGFSYEYLGATNLAAPQAYVVDGVLAPDEGPAYRALVVDRQEYITPEVARSLLEFARRGLPIVFIDEVPRAAIGSKGQDIVAESIEALAQFSNVVVISDEDSLPATLVSLGVEPRVSVSSETPSPGLWSVWRKTTDADLVFLFNEEEAELSTYTLSFDVSADKIPYQLDAWTGEQTRVGTYQRSETGITLDVTLAGNQTTIFVFQGLCGDDDNEPLHATSHSTNIHKLDIHKLDWRNASRPLAYLRDSAPARISLSTGEDIEIPALEEGLPTIELKPWNLTVESWVPDSDPSNTHSVMETFELGEQNPLVPWSEIRAVQNASGVGIYTTPFTLPESSTSPSTPFAVLLNLGTTPSLIRGWLNDVPLPPLDISRPEVLLPLDSRHFVTGENTLRVEVSSNLFNAVSIRIDELRTGGGGQLFEGIYEGIPLQGYGLRGEARITVLRGVELEI
ncbi:hypothetical protein BJY01DRAFT_245062 [Aspergillus pseudoustus]|uniref:Glycoside hydrolase family 42 N-terminal domain-containing protein n=1 Tax=Aspergillus pseudoustus TaxID=1810923 RepID=A0ABR4KFS3_9EURO